MSHRPTVQKPGRSTNFAAEKRAALLQDTFMYLAIIAMLSPIVGAETFEGVGGFFRIELPEDWKRTQYTFDYGNNYFFTPAQLRQDDEADKLVADVASEFGLLTISEMPLPLPASVERQDQLDDYLSRQATRRYARLSRRATAAGSRTQILQRDWGRLGEMRAVRFRIDRYDADDRIVPMTMLMAVTRHNLYLVLIQSPVTSQPEGNLDPTLTAVVDSFLTVEPAIELGSLSWHHQEKHGISLVMPEMWHAFSREESVIGEAMQIFVSRERIGPPRKMFIVGSMITKITNIRERWGEGLDDSERIMQRQAEVTEAMHRRRERGFEMLEQGPTQCGNVAAHQFKCITSEPSSGLQQRVRHVVVALPDVVYLIVMEAPESQAEIYEPLFDEQLRTMQLKSQ